MTYTAPELLLVGAAQTLVLGQCGPNGLPSAAFATCERLETPNPSISRNDPLW